MKIASMDPMGKTWRVYFQEVLWSNKLRDELRHWCRTNCEGSWKLFRQHIRFYSEGDALLFVIAYGGIQGEVD